jgi:hypothetical protein
MSKSFAVAFVLISAIVSIGNAQTFQLSDPLQKADMVYEGNWAGFACGSVTLFTGSDPCHVGMYIGNSTVVQCVGLREPDAVHSVTLSAFENSGYRGTKSLRQALTSAQRDQVAAYINAKDARLSYYDALHNNQKGGYAGGCASNVASCYDGFDYFNEFDCVGLTEKAYEKAGFDPTPNTNPGNGCTWEGYFYMFPNDQFFSCNVTYPGTALSDHSNVSGTIKQGYWSFFYLTVPSGAPFLDVSTTSSTDVDLYVRRLSYPTLSSYDCRPALLSGNENCHLTNPLSGLWAVAVYNASGSTASFSLQTSYSAVVPTVTINSASTSPQSTPSTSTFSIQYGVTASASTTVMLGASLRLHGTTAWIINDSPHDIPVNLSAGSSSVSRQFSVSAAQGLYDLLVAVWRDQNGNGIIDGADQQLSAFTLLSAETLTSGPTQCAYSINSTSAAGLGGGGSGSVQVTGSPSGCTGSWSASPASTGGWLTLSGTTSQSGAGNWSVGYSYPANPSTSSSRTGTVSFSGSFPSGGTFTLTQSPSSVGACSYSLNPSSAPGSGEGGSGSVQVTGSPSGCTGSWSALPVSNGGWLTLGGTTSQSGAGNWSVGYSYPANPSTSSSRTGTVSFSGSFPSGGTFTLTQSPATAGACTYSIAPTSAPGSGLGGIGSVQVTGSPSGCSGSWSAVASSNGNWLTLTGTTGGSGANTWQVPYSFGANPSTTSTRAGAISFSFGSTFTLTQDAAVGNNLPNLTPYQPAGWSNKIVISTVTGTHADATSFGPSDSLYIDWAVINSGLASTTAQFYSQLLVDGVVVGSWYTDPPLNPGGYGYVEDFPLGSLSAGAHTISVQTNTTGSVVEFDYTDNQFSRTIVVGGGGGGAHINNNLGDFNGDHKADVLWRIDLNGLNAMWLMNGTTKAVGQYLESAGSQWIVAGIGDFDGDGRADVLWRNPVTGENAMWLMNGTTKVLGTYIEPAGPQWVVAGVGDFNGDGKADILWRNPANGDNAMWLMNGPTKAVGVVIESAGPNWSVVGVGDFNGDGKADILWRDDAAGNDAMWLMNGPTKAVGAWIEGAPPRWRVVGVGDFNFDGRADILWRDPVTGENAMWLMNGTTKTLGTYLESAGPQWSVAGVGDLDGDGRADILWRDTSGLDAIWLMNGTTKTVGAYTEAAPLPWRVVP